MKKFFEEIEPYLFLLVCVFIDRLVYEWPTSFVDMATLFCAYQAMSLARDSRNIYTNKVTIFNEKGGKINAKSDA